MADKLTVKDNTSVDDARMAVINLPPDTPSFAPHTFIDSEGGAHYASGPAKTGGQKL